MSKNKETTEQLLKEASLIPPVFTGNEIDISAAFNSFSSIINSIGYMNQPSYGIGSTPVPITAENKKAILTSLIAYASSQLEDLCKLDTPIVPQAAVPTYVPPGQTNPEVEVTYESKQSNENPMLRRMRELAGIPHESNRV